MICHLSTRLSNNNLSDKDVHTHTFDKRENFVKASHQNTSKITQPQNVQRQKYISKSLCTKNSEKLLIYEMIQLLYDFLKIDPLGCLSLSLCSFNSQLKMSEKRGETNYAVIFMQIESRVL